MNPAPAAATTCLPASSPAQILRGEGLTKRYTIGSSTLTVLEDCSITVREGEFISIMGKSGSGKSTLLHLLGALDVPQKGQVYFRGEPVFAPVERRRLNGSLLDAFSAAERRRNWLRRTQFGFVFQFYHLLPDLNVLENVLLPRMVAIGVQSWRASRRAERAAAEQLIESLGLAARARHRPNELSGGERQRVAIARALVHQPAILFADEPTGNLDAESGGSILSLLRRLHADGQTIVLVTHDAAIAAQADRMLLLENRRLSARK